MANPFLDQFLGIVLQLINKASQQHLPQEQRYRDGGYLLIIDTRLPNDPTHRSPLPVGVLNAYTEECAKYATEKSRRLLAHPERLTSRESFDQSKEAYGDGGAIRVGHYIYSFSGLPDGKWDEALMLAAVHRMRLISLDEVQAITSDEIFHNHFTGLVCAGL